MRGILYNQDDQLNTSKKSWYFPHFIRIFYTLQWNESSDSFQLNIYNLQWDQFFFYHGSFLFPTGSLQFWGSGIIRKTESLKKKHTSLRPCHGLLQVPSFVNAKIVVHIRRFSFL